MPPTTERARTAPPAEGGAAPAGGAAAHPRGAPPPRSSWRSRLYRWDTKASPYAFVTPFFLFFFAFGLFPLVWTAWISLNDFKLGTPMVFVGLENYRWLFASPEFYNSLWRTVTIGILATVPQLMLALGLAHLLNYQMVVRNFFRISMLMPYATSVAASTLVFAQLFGRDNGFINWVLSWVGIDAVDWRNGDLTAQIAIAVIVTWRWTGYNALIYLAGMQSISQDLYEAAALDGASKWQQFRHVTLPGLRPTILFTVVVSTIGATQLFGEPLLFGGTAGSKGGADHQFQTLGLYLYDQGWINGHLGRASAVAWLMLAILLIIAAVNLLIVRRMRKDR